MSERKRSRVTLNLRCAACSWERDAAPRPAANYSAARWNFPADGKLPSADYFLPGCRRARASRCPDPCPDSSGPDWSGPDWSFRLRSDRLRSEDEEPLATLENRDPASACCCSDLLNGSTGSLPAAEHHVNCPSQTARLPGSS